MGEGRADVVSDPGRSGQGEHVFFSERGIQITSARAIFPGVTYAMANITSVSARNVPPSRVGPLLTVVAGLVGLAANIVVGVAIILLAVLWWVTQKAKYFVVVGSSSGQATPLMTPDREWVDRIVQAMNEAFIKRG